MRMGMCVSMCVSMRVAMIAAAKEPGGGDVHDQTGRGDPDGLVEMDRHRRKEPCGCLVADDQGDYRKDDGARVSGKIAKLSGAENKAGIVGVPPRISISQRRDQERQSVGRHMKPVGDHGERSIEGSAGDFRHHHDQCERDRRPCPALVRRMADAKEDVAMAAARRRSGVLNVHDPFPSPRLQTL
jgi:hypothetical protein